MHLMRVYVLPATDCRLWISTSQVHELDHWSNILRSIVDYKLRAKSQDMLLSTAIGQCNAMQ